MSINSPADVELLRRAVRREFPEEVDFLLSLPLVLVSEHYIFVHGGIPGEDCLDDPAGLDHWNCMKNDDFLRQGYRFHKKWCIVGHWPATLYREDHPCADPLVSPEQQIVSIDGGCAIKRDGQLNALRLPPVPAADAFTWESYDPLPKGVALDPQAPSEQPIYIRFGDNLLEILERGEEFCLCRHKATGKILSILTKDVWEKHDRIVCEDSTDYLLPVQPGDVLSLIDSTSRGWLAKKDGCTGWYTGRLREEG